MNIIDVKESLCDKSVYTLLAPSVFNPISERLLSRAEKYQADDKVKAYAYSENGEYKGIIAFKIKEQTAEILGIAVNPEYQGKGIGSRKYSTVLLTRCVQAIMTVPRNMKCLFLYLTEIRMNIRKQK